MVEAVQTVECNARRDVCKKYKYKYNFETFGGFGKGVTCLLKELSAIVMNKLTTAQYEETTWGARGWLAFQSQRLSVKLHLAVAYQIGQELGLAACRGADQRDDAC